jgi:hypothetical protein
MITFQVISTQFFFPYSHFTKEKEEEEEEGHHIMLSVIRSIIPSSFSFLYQLIYKYRHPMVI